MDATSRTALSEGRAQVRHGVVLLAAAIMPIMAITSLVPVLPLLMREFGGVAGSEFLVPMAITIPALCVAMFSPLAGWLSDRVGRKNLLVIALLLYAGSGIIPWFLDSLMQIIAARIALGICEAAIMTVATALIGDYFHGERRDRWIALQIAVVSVAAIVLIAVGGGLGEILGSRGPFLLYLLALPVALAAAAILFEPSIRRDDQAESGLGLPFGAVLPLIGITLAVGIVFYTVIVQLGPILELSGEVSPGVIGLIGAATNLAVGVGTLVFERMKNWVGPRMLALGLVLASVGYAGAGLSSELAAISTFAIIACIGCGILLPNMLTWTMGRLPAQVRGRGTGMWTGAFFLGQFLAPLVTTASLQVTHGLANTLLLYSGLIALGALVTFLMGLGKISAVAMRSE